MARTAQPVFMALAGVLVANFALSTQAEEPAAPAPPGVGPSEKQAVPPADRLAAAEKQLKDIYKTEYAKSDAVSRAGFAKELLKQAPVMKDDLAAQYVMLRDAREFAGTGRDLETALAAAKMLGERFEVDAGELKASSFLAIARSGLPPEEAEKAFAAGLDLLEELEKLDQFENIEKVAQGLDNLARVAKSPALAAQAGDRLKDIRARQVKWQQVKSHLAKLKEKPDDPEANLAVGRYYAEVKRDFPKALPYLAKGSDAGLKAVAQKDLANPTDLDGRLAVGDAWWEAGEKKTGNLKPALRLRAAFWYEQIVDGLTGLKKAVVQKRIDQANTVAQASVRPQPITWKEGAIRTVKYPGYPVGFIPASRWGLLGKDDADGTTHYGICDLETGELVREVVAGLHANGCAVSPDGRTALAFGAKPGTAVGDDTRYYCIVDLRTNQVSAMKPWPVKWPFGSCAVCEPDGEVAIWQENRQVCAVRLRDGVRLTAPVSDGGGFSCWLRERKELLIFRTNHVVFYDAQSGKEKRKVAIEPETKIGQPFSRGTPSPDGNLLLCSRSVSDSASYHGLVDLRRGKWVQVLPFVNATVSGKNPQNPVFLSDSRRVAGISVDGAFRIWEALTWKELFSVPGTGLGMVLSPDGRFVLLHQQSKGVVLVGLPKNLWPGAGN